MSAAPIMPVIRLTYELAYLEARQRSGMHLTSKERARIGDLRGTTASDPSHGRRAHRRFGLDVAAVASFDRLSAPVEVKDFSAGGCRLVAPVVLRVGQRLKLSFEYGRRTLVFFAEVKRLAVKEGMAHLGVAFYGIPLELRRFRPRAPSIFDQALDAHDASMRKAS